ncbi:MAG: bacterial Ig-like domain-containing protein [Clostridia bacterium]|nr:bacterial Ig-like domain-containing protein [Clostridia bacterium]
MNKKLILILLAMVLIVSSMVFLASCGEDVNIDHIEMYSMPKTQYALGESLDIKDASVLVVYKNNTEKLVPITSSMLSGFDSNTLGVQYIKVYYENHSTIFTVTVSRANVSHVELVTPETNLNYIEGQPLRTDGSYMLISFDDHSSERIEVTKDMCSGYDPDKIGSQIISVVGYLDGVEYTSSFVVTVTERELTGIEVTTAPTKKIYYVGDSVLDLTGGELFLKYNSGYSTYIDMTDVDGNAIEGLSLSWDSSVVNNRSSVTVEYGGKTASFQVEVKVRDVSSYEVITPVKEQMQNLDLDVSGAVIRINYNNGESEDVTLPSDKVTFVGYDKTKAGTQEVALLFSYGGVALSAQGIMEINVAQREAIGLEMVDAPDIYQDTEFDVTEFSVRIVYNNGERGEDFNLNSGMIAWENNIPVTSYAQAGEKSWYISYSTGIDLDYKFTVKELLVVNVELHNASNVIAFLGGDANTDGVTMTITYNSGRVDEDVALTPDMLSFDSSTMGVKLAKVVYATKYNEGYEPMLSVTVVKKITSIEVGGVYRNTYILGEEFSAAGMELVVNYEFESASTLIKESDVDFYDSWSFSTDNAQAGLYFTEVGEANVYINNPGLVEPYKITVTVKNDFKELGPIFKLTEGELVEAENLGSTIQGLPLDLSSYYIMVTFESNVEYVQLNDSMVDYNVKNTAVGERKVTIYYPDVASYVGEVERKYDTTATVLEKSVVGVKMLTAPEKDIYYYSEDKTVVATEYKGIAISIEYDNGTYSSIDVDDAIAKSRLNFVSVDVSEIGPFEVTYSYTHTDNITYSGSFFVEIIDSMPVSVKWTLGTIPEVELTIGSKFNPLVMGYRENGIPYSLADRNIDILSAGSNVPVPKKLSDIIDIITVEGYNANQTGTQDVRLVYGDNKDLYVTVKVNVKERRLEALELVNDNANGTLTVIQGAPIDLSLLSLKLLFSDGATTQVPMDASYINRSDDNAGGYDINNATIGKREVTISYLYANESAPVSLTVEFVVLEKSLVKIEINDIPKQYYIEHEPFDISTGSIMLYYDNGTTETRLLTEATINSSTSPYNVDNARFDNSEFTGFSKVQRIYIRFSNCNTSYNVYMRDRRNVEAEYAEGNVYNFTYGQAVAPIIELKGYNAYGDSDRKFSFASDSYKVEYIPQDVWLTQGRVEGVDYTEFPSTVGVYNVVVSYLGDDIHNAYEDASKKITINKKVMYVGFATASKIYGTENPEIKLTLGESMDVVSNNPLSLFQNGDTFQSANFNPDYQTTYASKAYLIDANGNYVTDGENQVVVDIFDIVYLNLQNDVVDVNVGTAQGRYVISIANQFESPNYQIYYKNAVLTIGQREVVVRPQSVSYTYGAEIVPVIPFETYAVEGKESESGVYGADKLAGSLSREKTSEKSVGDYLVTIGSLQTYNPNYKIIFENVEDDATIEKEGAYVTILPRKIYVKTDSIIKVYGEEFVAPNVKFFSDPACTQEANAFASGDSVASIGQVTFSDAINKYTSAGNYTLSCTIDMSGDGADNYDVKYVNGYVEVSARPVNVIATAGSKVYGDPEPLMGYSVSGVEGEKASGLIELADGSIETFNGSLQRVSGENYGDYNVQIGTLSNPNYEIRFTSAKFSILRKELYAYISEENLTKVYDGKIPSISAYTLYEARQEGASVYTAQDVSNLITFSFDGASKNFGLYRVNVAINSNNYSIALFNQEGYVYSIERRVIAITESEYYDIPNNLEYKGEAYNFYARINTKDLQYQYNSDGSIATDDNNNPLYDDPTVTLSIASATYAGNYTVSVLELADKNYELDTSLSAPVTFTILPRSVYVVIKTNAENHTIEREFNNQVAYISANDYTLENLISERDIPYFSFGIYAGDNIVTAKDVLYAEDDSIIGYDIRLAENSIDANYVVKLKEAYKYKIVPKGVVIRIYEKYLTKSYDGTAPAISSSMFAPVSAVTGFDSNSVSFSFIREGNDGRDNTSVGSYTVVANCSDRNFSVTTQQPYYVYQITSGNVSVSINSSAMEKAYDGKEFEFDYNDLTFTAYYGNQTIIHNFRYGDAYDTFVEQLAEISTRITALDYQLALVDFVELGYAKTNLESSRSSAYLLRIQLQSIENPMQAENTATILSAVETIITNLSAAITAIDNGDSLTAESIYGVCLEHMANIKSTFDKEESYIAFIFGNEDDNTPVEVGQHPFEVRFSDYNRNFTLLNSNLNVSISTHTLYINVNDIVLTYGTTLSSIPFDLFDPRTGEVLDKNEYRIVGTPSVDGTIKNVGRYAVSVSGMYITEDGSTASPNFVVLGGEVGEIEVVKATLSIQIQNVYNPDVFVYGKTVESSQLSGQYELINYGSIPENPSNEAQRKMVEDAYAWAVENGYENASHLEKMRLYYGGLQYSDVFEDVLKTNAVKYNCYINGDSGAQIFDTTLFDAGDYPLSATGFKADNYNIRVVPGVLTVAKRALSIYTQTGYYEKTYGDTSVKYIYTGFVGNDNENSLSVYTNDGGTLGTEVNSLANMVWEYTYDEENQVDPLAATTGVSDELFAVEPSTGDYLLRNYTINFGTVNIKVVKAPLTCTLKSAVGDVVSSLYMAIPTENDYVFSYDGFKNEDNESLIAETPVVNFKNGSTYFSAGVHTLGQSYIDVSSIELDNYYVAVEPFQYEVKARKVYVTLNTDTINTVMSTSTNSYTLTPYIAEVLSGTDGAVTNVSIISGQYGYTDFEFNIEESNAEVLAEFNKVAITRYSQTDSAAVFDKIGDTYRKEIYRYSDMYKHSIVGDVDHDKEEGTFKLANMTMNSINFKFEYVPFTIKVYSTIQAVTAYATEKFVGQPSDEYTAYVNSKINFMIINSALKIKEGTIQEMAGVLNIEGNMPTKSGTSSMMTYTLNDASYNYQLAKAFTSANYSDNKHEYYTNYYSGLADVEAVSVSDNRTKTYNYSSVATCTLPIRYYSQISEVVTNPELNGGAEYKVAGSATTATTFTTVESLYNAMRLEIAVSPNASVKVPSLEIGFNANETEQLISLLFSYGAGNSVSVLLKSPDGNLEATATYALAYGNLFDGNVHDIRAYLDKENLMLILYIDGVSGAALDLMSVMNTDGKVVLDSPLDIEESTALSLTVAGDYIIRSITLSEQGLYDGVGAHIRLPISADSVLKVTTLLDSFTATLSNLNALFGLTNLNDTYSVTYYLDGEQLEYSDSIRRVLANGVHFAEVALYKEGVLVDYDSRYIVVERNSIGYVVPDVGTPQVINPGTKLNFYTISADYPAQANVDGSLVASSATSQYAYALGGARQSQFNAKYAPEYFNMAFGLTPSATYTGTTASYLVGEYTTTIELFSNQGFSRVIDKRNSGDTTYQGAALQFIRKQTEEVAFGTTNTKYTYTVKLDYYINGNSPVTDQILMSDVTDDVFEISLFKDRNESYFGSNGIILVLRSLVSDKVYTYDFGDEDFIEAREAEISIMLHGVGDRVTIYNADFEENVAPYRDYLLGDVYKASNESLILGASETLTLINNAGMALYSNYSTLNFNFSIADSYTQTAGDVVRINLADSKLDKSGNGVYLEYDLATNELKFTFYRGNRKSKEQVLALSGSVTGSHSLSVRFEKELVLASTLKYVGGDSGINNLYYGDTDLTNTTGMVVHYSEVSVTIDGVATTFYMPLYDDMGLWIDSTGYSGTNNKYSDVTGLTSTPTFLSLYNYTSVVAPDSTAITVDGYMVTLGECHSLDAPSITETPII